MKFKDTEVGNVIIFDGNMYNVGTSMDVKVAFRQNDDHMAEPKIAKNIGWNTEVEAYEVIGRAR